MSSEDDPIARAAYDELADTYAEDVRANAYNAELEFPATSSLIPNVEGKRVLDAGCGTGFYTKWLVERGADVLGVDVSEEMLSHAVEAVGDHAEFEQADLGEPLDFTTECSFDGVVSALSLGYIDNWNKVFAEFERVLRPGGFLVFSTGHPLDQFAPEDGEGENYFEVERASKEWDVDVPYYRRPFSEILNPVLDNGFQLDKIVEPQPTEAFAEQRPERYEKESRNPVFLCVRATKQYVKNDRERTE
ncbi:class I SAM-dependent methyltransferase [Halogeometricum borinquense]|uniref:Class I SAM-dependent methyltransferase n=1 Tax=Halogeometricum borinquense TaxID=60847 RepID=A0A482TMS6_9EURY|nr:class I SAM-dependent methyltransferase [Halogeometricum borinquense]RYJ13299.1 class I SAM-dependent methyltransferase [Halogeometricum borinquense]